MYYTVTISRIHIVSWPTVYKYLTLVLAISLYINRIQLLKRICAVTRKLLVRVISQCLGLLSAQIQVIRWANKRVTFHAYAAILNIALRSFQLKCSSNIDSIHYLGLTNSYEFEFFFYFLCVSYWSIGSETKSNWLI